MEQYAEFLVFHQDGYIETVEVRQVDFTDTYKIFSDDKKHLLTVIDDGSGLRLSGVEWAAKGKEVEVTYADMDAIDTVNQLRDKWQKKNQALIIDTGRKRIYRLGSNSPRTAHDLEREISVPVEVVDL